MKQDNMKCARGIACFSILILVFFAIYSCNNMDLPYGKTPNSDSVVPVAGIELDWGTIEFDWPDSAPPPLPQQLTATVIPENATDKSVHWMSTRPQVAEVNSDGLVTAMGAIGTAVIMAISGDGGKIAVCTVTVSDPGNPPPPPAVPVQAVAVSPGTLILIRSQSDTAALTATVYPANADIQTVRWMSTNTNIVIVDENTGTVAAVSDGFATIVVTTDDGSKIAFCTVNVRPPTVIPVNSVTISPNTLGISVGDSYSLTTNVQPPEATQGVTWESSHPEIATVTSSGVVQAGSSEGSTIITARSVSNPSKYGTCSISVGGVQNVTVTSVTPGNFQFIFTWNNPAPVSYRYVEITTVKSPSGEFINSSTLDSPTTTFTLNSLTNGQAYSVTLIAHYADGYFSAPTIYTVTPINTVTATTINGTAIPIPTTGGASSAVSIDTGQYTGTLGWNPSVPAGDYFKAGVTYEPILYLSANSDFSFTGLLPTAFSWDGTAAVSGSINGSTATLRFTPTTTTGVTVSGRITNGGNAGVQLKENGVPVGSPVSANGSGDYSISSVRAGTYTVYASSGGAITESPPFTITYSSNTVNMTMNTPITAFTLTNFADQPVIGGTATTATRTETQYTVDREWRKHSDGSNYNGGTFLAGTGYDALLTITAEEGWIFPASTILSSFTYAGAGVSLANLLISPNMKTAKISVQFPSTASINVTGNVTVSSAAVSGANVQLRVGTTDFGTPVTTDISGNYTIPNVPAGSYNTLITYGSYAPYVYPTNGMSFEVRTQDITIPEAALNLAIPSNQLNLSTLFPAPVPGNAPVTSLNTSGRNYTAATSISWYTVAGTPVTGSFGQTGYRAIFTLTPQAGYSFRGLTSNSFTYDQANANASIADNGSEVSITVAFIAPPFSTVPVVNEAGFLQKINWIKENGQRNQTYTITLGAHIAIAPLSLSTAASSGLAGVTIKIQGNGGWQNISLSTTTGALFSLSGAVSNPLTLVLENQILLDGRSRTPVSGCVTDANDNLGPLVYIGSNATFKMNTGSKIAGNTNTTNNYMTAAGGAVSVAAGGRFDLSGGEIYCNTVNSIASSGTPGPALGGGIYNSGGTVTVTAGTINGNIAKGIGGTASGGGLYSENGTVIISGGTIEYNEVTGNLTYGALGGGIFSTAGAGRLAELTISGGTIKNNTVATSGTAGGSNGGLAAGGGIYSAGQYAELKVYNDVIIENNSVTCYSGDACGGGIYTTNKSTFTLAANSSISNNTVTTNGSAKNAYGAGIYASGNSTFTLESGSEINGNQAIASLSGSNAYGGGIYAGVTSSPVFTVNLKAGSFISGNKALSATTGTAGKAYGGGMYIFNGTVDIYGTLSNNTADGYYARGGALFITGNLSNSLELKDNGTISNNTVSSRNSGITETTAAGGGGIYSTVGFRMDGSSTVISGNTASNTGLSISGFGGGGVYLYNAMGRVTNGTISGNSVNINSASSGSGGGGIYVYNGSTYTFTKSGVDSSIIYGNDGAATDNTASNGIGHAVYVRDSDKKRNLIAGASDGLDSTTSPNWD